MESVKIYALDGTLQCGLGKEVSLEEMKKRLLKANVEVISMEKRKVPYEMLSVCGAPTGSANVYTIPKTDLEKIHTLKFSLWVFDEKSVEVYKYDGTLQCGYGEEVPLEVMEKELLDAGITVIGKRKDNDGLMHTAMCGALTGQVNVYEIDSNDFEKAGEIGFEYFIWGKKFQNALVDSDNSKDNDYQLEERDPGIFPF